VPAGQAVQVNLTSSSARSANELYVRYAAAPDLGHYDFIYSHPLQANQQVLIPTTQAGWYYLLVRGVSAPDGEAPYTIEADVIPFSITSVTPTNIGDNGQVTLTLHGALFQSGATVALAGAAGYTPDKITFVDSTTMKARFQFTNAVNGPYTAILTNPNGAITAATNAVMIEPALPLYAGAAGYQVNIEPRLGAPFKWSGYVFNQGNIDIPYLPVGVLLDQDLPMTVNPPAEAITLDTSPTGSMSFLLRDVPPGAKHDFSFAVPQPGGQSCGFAVFPDPENRLEYVSDIASMADDLRQYFLTNTEAVTLPDDMATALNDPFACKLWVAQALADQGLLDPMDIGLLPGYSGVALKPARPLLTAYSSPTPRDSMLNNCGCDENHEARLKTENDRLDHNLAVCHQNFDSDPPNLEICFKKVIGISLNYAELLEMDYKKCKEQCKNKPPPGCSYYSEERTIVTEKTWPGGIVETKVTKFPAGVYCPVKPKDPNELQGPAGFSAAAFVGVQQPWLYTIYFENVSNAAAYARQVLVTNKLEANLDLRSFRLGEIAFSGVTITVPTNRCFYQTRVALPPPHAANIVADVTAGVDVANNLVFWTIDAIDLNTGQLVESAQEGILPPNDANNSGQGHATYTILPASGVTTGTIITNQATIVFDINAPLDTNPTTNTVDAVPPTSTVATLPASLMDTNFILAWFGTDDLGGSGVSSYDVYVSDNGGPWVVWLSNTTTNSATFSGQAGHYYYFYSRARDNAGNVEPAPASLQAQTFVSANQPPALQPLADHTAVVGTALVLTNAASDPDPGDRLTFSLSDAPAGASIDPATGTIRWDPTPWQARTTNLFTMTVTDNGLPPLSASQSFLVVVGDYLELGVGSADLLAGQSGCVPLRLLSTATLTNLSFTLGIPPGRLSNLSVSPGVPQVAQAQLVPINASNAQIILSAGPGSVLSGTQTLASVCFDTSPAQPSFVAQLLPDTALAQASDGRSLTGFALFPGRLVVVATQPVIEAAAFGTNQLQLTLYGRPALRYSVESATDLRGPWSPVASLTLTNETQTISFPIQGTGAQFFRLHQQ
jgi:hypothetical protein